MELPGGFFPRRRSLALDDAAAAEARKAAGIEDDDVTPEADMEMDSEDERSRKKAEGVGNKLAAKFTAKGTTRKGKKTEEVGPSGQTYTPLEKQFMEIKGDNPDVLLLMEGESLHRSS